MKIDFSKTIGKIKPMYGVGQPPVIGNVMNSSCASSMAF